MKGDDALEIVDATDKRMRMKIWENVVKL